MTGRIVPNPDIAQAILALDGADATRCFQCGMCMAVCPWTHLEAVSFPVYQTPQKVKMGAMVASEDAEEIEREVAEVYRCVGCEACLERCPHDIDMPKVMRAIRRMLVEYDSYPRELRDSVSRIQSDGNPFGEPRQGRSAVTETAKVPAYKAGMDYLLFRCCVPAYDPVAKRAARAILRCLQRAETSFGALDGSESCCSESVRRAGAEDAFQSVAGSNVAAFKEVGARKVLTTSPHCMATFVREYGEIGAELEVEHYTQVLARALDDGRIKPTKAVPKKVVFHDPCTLGRQNGVYDEPRKLLRAIPELELGEIPTFNRAESLCCGGGSGGVWIERKKGERMSDVRVQQAVDTGANVLAVACPYCHQMFEDSVKSLGATIEIRDVGELLAESLGLESPSS